MSTAGAKTSVMIRTRWSSPGWSRWLRAAAFQASDDHTSRADSQTRRPDPVVSVLRQHPTSPAGTRPSQQRGPDRIRARAGNHSRVRGL